MSMGTSAKFQQFIFAKSAVITKICFIFSYRALFFTDTVLSPVEHSSVLSVTVTRFVTHWFSLHHHKLHHHLPSSSYPEKK
jgi:hypothetical protein